MAIKNLPSPQTPTAVYPPGPSLAGGQLPATVLPQPLAPTPMQGPNLPGSPAVPTLGFTSPTVGAAPAATPYGAFDPNSAMVDQKALDFRLGQGLKARQRSAAARGTLLTGGTTAALDTFAQGVASDENQKAYERAIQGYTTNRDTNQQNFGQSLASYNAGTGATLDAARVGQSGATAVYDRNYGAGRDAYHDARDAAVSSADTINANASALDAYRQQMEDYRAALANGPMNRQSFAPTPRRLPGDRGMAA